jgi:hypothetical protein
LILSLSLSLSLSLIRALRDIALCFVSFFPGCILAIFCLGSFSRSPCLFQLRSCCIFFIYFFARDAPAFSSCDTDDGGFNPSLLFCVLLQNYLACLISSSSSLDVSSFGFVLPERVSMAAESGLQFSVAERRFRGRAVL